MNLPLHHFSLRETRKFLVVFYTVGVLGMVIPFTTSFFRELVPYSLWMCFFLLAVFHVGKPRLREMLALLTVALSGFFIEVVGVSTGAVFGRYVYGESLGLNVFNTPILIGFNWLFLVYTTASVVDVFPISGWVKVILGALAMVTYDLVIEMVAPSLDLWSWQGDVVPFQNYAAWFVIATLFHGLFRICRVSTINPLSFPLFVLQLLFFMTLYVILTL